MENRRIVPAFGTFEDGLVIFDALLRAKARKAGPYIDRFAERALDGEYGYDPDLIAAAIAIKQLFRDKATTKAEAEAIRIARKKAGYEPRGRGREARYESTDPNLRDAAHLIAQRYMTGDITRAQALRELNDVAGGHNATRARLLDDLCDAFRPPSER